MFPLNDFCKSMKHFCLQIKLSVLSWFKVHFCNSRLFFKQEFFNDLLLDQQNFAKLKFRAAFLDMLFWSGFPLCPGVSTKLFGTKILQLKRQTEAETKINNKKHTSFKVLFRLRFASSAGKPLYQIIWLQLQDKVE